MKPKFSIIYFINRPSVWLLSLGAVALIIFISVQFKKRAVISNQAQLSSTSPASSQKATPPNLPFTIDVPQGWAATPLMLDYDNWRIDYYESNTNSDLTVNLESKADFAYTSALFEKLKSAPKEHVQTLIIDGRKVLARVILSRTPEAAYWNLWVPSERVTILCTLPGGKPSARAVMSKFLPILRTIHWQKAPGTGW